MDDTLQAIQAAYISELKKEVPRIKKWWTKSMKDNTEKRYPDKLIVDFDLRWPSGMGGHPRLIEIFRRYFLAAEARNLELEEAGRQYEQKPVTEEWGLDTEPPSRENVPPIDLLLNDLASEHQDLHRVMRTMQFIPIGMRDGEIV
ncbi:hypothetical protein EN943_28115 [Mesorhizobium sp. M7A.F.Ca.US.006.01.1.1]|uniref:hypothetical protein n=1 Tax=Mesorhizobium sp. M7A.F.Ca.US.006.01.1.1 TaxID=2496707 RepID=UPI000FCBA7F5|nr:hypothetical protein [Mesorhizobium sp. M7A.F.Ca.US.006.01.1.1]RUZ73160.1 hypothetical protein EN943_28115 [Mesorhizobium sp. M7A.F.Ca.US.006.01.1.1]